MPPSHAGSADRAPDKPVDVWPSASAKVEGLDEALRSVDRVVVHRSKDRCPWRKIARSSAIVLCPLDVPIRELRSLVRWLDGSL